MAAEFQDVLIGFKSGVVIKTSVEGGVKTMVEAISNAINTSKQYQKHWTAGPDGGYLIECKDIDFILPGDGVVVVSGK